MRPSRPPLVPLAVAALAAAGPGCYSGARATADVNAAWKGRTRAELEGRWGDPSGVTNRTAAGTGGTLVAFTHTKKDFVLPEAEAELILRGDLLPLGGSASFTPGQIWDVHTVVVAAVDGQGRVERVEGPSLRWGPPNDVNLRWGTILGLHVGFGRLDDTSTPLPSGGAYIGGMLTPTFGLAGVFSLASGLDEAGGAMAFAGGLGAAWWPSTRLSVRAAPVLTLDFDPGFEDPSLGPGLNLAASYAFVKVGTLAIDLRLDVTGGPSAAFGSLGVGVNMN